MTGARGERQRERLACLDRAELPRIAHQHQPVDLEQIGEPDQPVDLGEGVDDDPADAILDRGAQLGEGLVVAVHPDPLPGEADPARDLELAAAADVEVQPLLHDPLGDRGAEEGLPGVVDVGPGEPLLEGGGEVVAEGSGPVPEVLLVHHVCRSAELRRQVGRPDPRHGEDTVGVAVHAAGPQLRKHRHDVGRVRQPLGCRSVAVGVEDTGLVRAHRVTSVLGRAPRGR